MEPLPENLRQLLNPGREPSRLLFAAPNDASRAAAVRELEGQTSGTSVVCVESLAALLIEDLDAVDLLVCCASLPDAGVLDTLEEVLLLRPDMPTVVLADPSEQEQAVLAVSAGAYDSLVREPGHERLLPIIVDKVLAVHQVKQDNARLQVQLTSTLAQLNVRNQQLQSLVQELKTIAATDALTEIANRRALTESLEQRYAQSVRENRDLAVLAIDMDGFKGLNDTVGHAAGDEILKLTARVLRANCRGSDVPGRIGGDEFVVVLPETDMQEARAVGLRIQEDFDLASRELCETLGHDRQVTMSIGLATRSLDPDASADGLLALADRALYSAKNLGRHRLVIHGESAEG